VVLIEAVAFVNDEATLLRRFFIEKKLTDKDVERSSDYCSRQSGLGKWISNTKRRRLEGKKFLFMMRMNLQKL
jgi:hypothetical protein